MKPNSGRPHHVIVPWIDDYVSALQIFFYGNVRKHKIYSKETTTNPLSLTSFSKVRPVYAFFSGSHSSSTKVSPSFIANSLIRKSNFFLPDLTASKYSGHVFFLIK